MSDDGGSHDEQETALLFFGKATEIHVIELSIGEYGITNQNDLV